ncbi:alpha/beta fold hydrolase [Aureimonas sp. AU12]|uniref:alpha/beta fold hydrolase n=1 Tax=Aureimonas sp. AU12 TaxID=1638161 RepID=UPI000B16231A|nr:alpha/beta hydrolase [Aureimonas sp. AU12]
MLMQAAARRAPPRQGVMRHDDHRPPGGSRETPVLLLHGAVQTRAIWQAQVEALEGTRRVVVPDLRGHGATPLGSAPFDIGAMAGDCVALLDALAIRRVIVVGVSLGGMIALELACRRPDRVEAIVIANTPRALVVTRWMRRILAALGPQRLLYPTFRLLGQARSARIGLWLAGLLVGRHWVGKTARRHFIAGFSTMQPQAIVATYRAIVECEPVDPRDIRCPCLVVEGADDAGTIREQSETIDRLAPRARRVEMPAGHVANLDDPRRFNAILTRFLGSLLRR